MVKVRGTGRLRDRLKSTGRVECNMFFKVCGVRVRFGMTSNPTKITVFIKREFNMGGPSPLQKVIPPSCLHMENAAATVLRTAVPAGAGTVPDWILTLTQSKGCPTAVARMPDHMLPCTTSARRVVIRTRRLSLWFTSAL